ncbi:oxygen-insensitive NADPH nitroreductase [Bacillus aerolatus]|uniref:Oxygen-insensitive NADPH nitroreductase n=1 Tax=Bacillus aerolatus TaxID=2653354 RepID=A0A6I1FJ50_9BACI|nr:oxygen-insensitive NADPH nitroreductase [Bacillus aerolatus]KAB7708610.1 oxygen-insensitive NADPH nitroreductase [Bacillus aerolatus]
MFDLLKSHASVRKYTNEQISDETFRDLLEAAQHAASSHFVQAYSVVRVKDSEKRLKLGELSKNKQQFESAALPLVFCADLKRLEKAVSLHGKTIEGSTAENLLVAVIDTALFAQNFVVAAESKGYGICYIGGVRNNPQAISELLNLPDYVIPLFGLTVGVPAESNEVKPRLPMEAILHEDSYDEQKYDVLLPQYDEQMSKYYASRTANKKDAAWTSGMAAFLSEPRRAYMLDFLQSKGFIKK